MKTEYSIEFTPPRELDLGCQAADSGRINCSQAFPDLARFKDRYYLAYRVAPSHFPSRFAYIQIVSADEPEVWQPERRITHHQDLRDPQFLIFGDDLYLFYMSHGSSPLRHEPDRIYYVRKTPTGWSVPTELPFSGAGFWNVKAHNDIVYMSIYTPNGTDGKRGRRHFQMAASRDLADWTTVFDSPLTRERLGSYQTSETTFAFDKHGGIYGTIRSLIYPNLNFAIPAGDDKNWRMRVDRFKCDGPKLFTHNGRAFLVGRRSLFHRLRSEPYRLFSGLRNAVNITRYSFSRKRTALYSFNPQALQISHITDLPSHGDTGYSAIAQMDKDRFLLIYYSSALNGKADHHWLRGQFNPTRLYSSILTIR